MTVVYPTSQISLDNRKPGHVGALNQEQTTMLQQMWHRLLKLFEQIGAEIHLEVSNKGHKTTTKKGRFFGLGSSNNNNKEETTQCEYFLGATTDPRWTSLPLKEGLLLIPGSLLREAFWGMVATDNPDSTVLRFLRARKWDLDASYNMLTNTLRWRLEMRLNEIVSMGESGLIEELERSKKGLGVQFKELLKAKMVTLGGPDKKGRGVCFINVQVHNKDKYSLEVLKILTVYVMETARIICGYPMDAICLVFNLENFTMSNMDFDVVKFLVSCFEAYYPETLGLACVHKAPWVFSTVWNLITPLLDPVVASKIQFTKNVQELEQYVDEDSLPIIITGDPNRPALDDRETPRIPHAGSRMIPADTPGVKLYWDIVAQYESKTQKWTQIEEFGGDKEVLDRLQLGQHYRVARVKAEKVLRGETSYHVKGLIHINVMNRLIVKYDTETWGEKDITGWV